MGGGELDARQPEALKLERPFHISFSYPFPPRRIRRLPAYPDKVSSLGYYISEGKAIQLVSERLCDLGGEWVPYINAITQHPKRQLIATSHAS